MALFSGHGVQYQPCTVTIIRLILSCCCRSLFRLFALDLAPAASELQLLKSETLSFQLFDCVPGRTLFVVIPRLAISSRPSNQLNASLLAPRIRLLLTILRIYKLYSLTHSLTHSLTKLTYPHLLTISLLTHTFNPGLKPTCFTNIANRRPSVSLMNALLHVTQAGPSVQIGFWATVCKTVRPMLSDRCLSCLSVLSCLKRWCIVAKRWDESR